MHLETSNNFGWSGIFSKMNRENLWTTVSWMPLIYTSFAKVSITSTKRYNMARNSAQRDCLSWKLISVGHYSQLRVLNEGSNNKVVRGRLWMLSRAFYKYLLMALLSLTDIILHTLLCYSRNIWSSNNESVILVVHYVRLNEQYRQYWTE